MKSLRRQKENSGFTMMETLVTLAIVVVLFALAAIPITKVRRDVRQTELDGKAEVVFLAAQNRMSLLQAAGQAQTYQNGAIPMDCVPVDAEAGRYGNDALYYVTSDQKEPDADGNVWGAGVLLPQGQMDDELWNNHWVVEFDPASGSVYAVFYSEEPLDYSPEGELSLRLRYRENRLKAGAKVGYYGGDSVGNVDTGELNPKLRILNGEKLLVQITCEMQANAPLHFYVNLTDESGHSTGDIRLTETGADKEVERDYRNYTATMVLDDLTAGAGMRFAEQERFTSCGLVPGENLTVQVRVESDSDQVDSATRSDTTNSLFAGVKKGADGNRVAGLRTGRHLQNLDEASGVNDAGAGVTRAITAAEQERDILFQSAEEDSWTAYYPGQTFRPIRNDVVKSYRSVGYPIGTTIYYPAIYDLTVETEEANAGLFESFGGGTLTDIRLVGASVTGGGNVGALAGELTGETLLDGCRVMLSRSQGQLPDDRTEQDLWLDGMTTGGLVGAVVTNRPVTIRNSLAATVARGETAVGGLVGRVDAGSITVERSYADSYLFSEEVAGGLLGLCQSACDMTVADCYAAGFLDAPETSGLVAGEVGGGDSLARVYSACAPLDGNRKLTYAIGKPGSLGQAQVERVYYLADSEEETPLAGTEPVAYTQWSGENRQHAAETKLGGAFSPDAVETYAYNLMEGLGLSVYSYPGLVGLPHYGDWQAQFESGSLVYYETYADGSTRFFGGNIDNLRDDGVVRGDGYGMVFQDEVPADIRVTVAGTEYTLDPAEAILIRITEKGETKTYYLAPLPGELVNPAVGTAYYTELTYETRTYSFHPYFANSAKAGGQTTALPEQVDIRTARQLYNLSLYYENYRELLPQKATFLQGRGIDYESYDWVGYGPGGTTVTEQAPIGQTEPTAFAHRYQGSSYPIAGVSFVSDSNGAYAGMFGVNTGTLEDIVIVTEKEQEEAPTARLGGIVQKRQGYVGVLAGKNAGTVNNCAVAGYVLDMHLYSGSTVYVGGLVGQNTGNIRRSSAVTPAVTATNTYAQLHIGGFVGSNQGQIRQSYALASVDVPVNRRGDTTLAGFAGENLSTIRNSYCATALSSAGAATYGFAPAGGSVVNSYYLSNGTYTFAGTIHLYDFQDPNTGASPVDDQTLAGLWLSGFGYADGTRSFAYPNTEAAAGSAYPYPTSVTGKAGAVHYGDWITQADLGTVGMVYWEHEVGGANSGYHFSFVGLEDGQLKTGTNLCEAYNDDGTVQEYGYGYYWKDGTGTATLTASVEYGRFELGQPDTAVARELEQQNPGFRFVAYRTGTDGMRLESGRSANGEWKLVQGGVTHRFAVCPFFANAYTYQGTGNDTGAGAVPGSSQAAYQVRSVEQLQFINWSYADGKGSTTTDVEAGNYRTFPYLQYTSSESYATQKRAAAEQGDSIGGPRPYRYWKQTHDLNGTSLVEGEQKNPEKNTLFYPIAGAVVNHSQVNYEVVLYNWFGGSYDGQSYYIKNIRIQSYCYNVGLFGTTAGADIRNIVLYSDNDAVIQRATVPTPRGGATQKSEYECAYALGGLVGLAYDYTHEAGETTIGTIANCAIAGYKVQDNSQNKMQLGEAAVGGLIGVSLVDLKNCSAVVDIAIHCTHRWADAGNPAASYPKGALNSAKYGNFVRVGGLVGGLRLSATNCYTGGKITVGADTLQERILAGDDTNSTFLTGNETDEQGNPVQAKWSKDYHNGTTPDPGTYVFVGGVGGSGFSSNFINFTASNDSSDGQPVYENCYTYIDLPDMEGSICAISVIGSLADRFGYGSGWVTYKNCYYWDETYTGVGFENVATYTSPEGKSSLSKLLSSETEREKMLLGNLKYLGSYLPDSGRDRYTYQGVTALTYDQMAALTGANIQTKNGLNKQADTFPEALGDGFGWVTREENGATVHGKYSFPGNNGVLDGQNYPFPTVLHQTNTFGETVNLHYGAWPTVGLFWSQGVATLDRIADYDGVQSSHIQLDLELKGVGPDQVAGETLAFTSTNEAVVTAAAVPNGAGKYRVTLTGHKTGAAEVEATLGRYTARLLVTVTAELTVAAQPNLIEQYLSDGDVTVKLWARGRNGAVISPVTWEVLNEDGTVAAATEPVRLAGEDFYTMQVKGLSEGETSLRITARRVQGGQTYEATAVVPVTLYAPGTLGIANTADSAAPLYRQGVLDREQTGWETPPADTAFAENAPVGGTDLFLYSRGLNAGLENFTVEAMEVEAGAHTYDVTTDHSLYNVTVGEAETRNGYSCRSLTVRGQTAGDITLRVTLVRAGTGGVFLLEIPYRLTEAHTRVQATFTDGRGNAVTQSWVDYGNVPPLPTAEELATMTPPEGETYADLTRSDNWTPHAGEPLFADTVFMPRFRPKAYTVVFEGTAVPRQEQSVTPGAALVWPATPQRSGYVFMGWTRGGTTRYQATDTYTPTEDVTFQPVWRSPATIQVKRTDNGAVLTTRNNVTDYDQGYTLTFSSWNSFNANDLTVTVNGNAVAGFGFSKESGWWSTDYAITLTPDVFPPDEN